MKSIFLFLSIVFLLSCGIKNPGNYSHKNYSKGPKNPEPGKCYAKAKIPNTYEESNKIYPIYTGENADNSSFVKKRKFITQHYSKKWMKKRSNNCISSNPEDCLVWCLTEIPEKSETYFIVTDTTKTKDFILKPIYEITNFKSGREDWVEVVCQSDVTSKLYKDIAFKLISLKYLSSNADLSKGSEDIHKALNKYARDNKLPSGNLNIALLKSLGVL